MRLISVDIEADGQVPAKYSMISLGAVCVDDLSLTFYGELAPITKTWSPDALRVSGFSREQTLKFEPAAKVMAEFDVWLNSVRRNDEQLRFLSDNAGFDWQYVNYYFWHFLERNPFGHSSLSLTSLYKGYTKNMRANFRHLRDRKHTHNALDDAIGNAEAFNKLTNIRQ